MNNGVNETTLTHKPLAVQLATPKSWPTALEICRLALGWTQKELLAKAFKGDAKVAPADVKKWESGKATPTMAQCQKLRDAMPRLYEHDDLLPLMLRASPKTRVPKPSAPSAMPEGWPGPPVSHFGAAVRWARESRGMGQGSLAMEIGISQSPLSQMEQGKNRVIRENYNKLLAMFPELQFAPLPEFSVKFQNTIKGKAYLASMEAKNEAARASHRLDVAAAEKGLAPPPPPTVSIEAIMSQNQAGAAYGVLRGELSALRAQSMKMKRDHEIELNALAERHQQKEREMTEQIVAKDLEVKAAEERLDREAEVLHGGVR